MVEKPIKVLAIVPYQEDFCAGQRFRIELWAKELVSRGIETEFLAFTDQKLTDILYQPGRIPRKAFLSATALCRLALKAFRAKRPDLIFIYREAAVIGPPIVEHLVKRWKVPIIYDIDEPLFVPYVSPSNGRMNKLKFFSKFDSLLAMSDCVFAVNQAIGDYAKNLNSNVAIVPMAVDTRRYQPDLRKKTNGRPVITWVGTRTNQPNIEVVVPALRRLAKEKEFKFRIIADDPMSFEGVDVEFVPWEYANEVTHLQGSDIGITPVGESPWSKWKFFFKIVQFMSLGLPVVGSPIGSNMEIISDGI